MGFTVALPKGTKDAEFETYAHLLRQQGKHLGNPPRVPDPEDPGRGWAYVWDIEEEARQFADELKEQTEITGWRVEANATPPSSGLFGPVLIQHLRRYADVERLPGETRNLE